MAFVSSKKKRFLTFEGGFPPQGSFVWLKVPDLGYGRRPTSDASFSLATSISSFSAASSTSSRFHLALVKDLSWVDSGLILTVYTCMKFTSHGDKPPETRLSTLSDISQSLLLPLPHVRTDGSQIVGHRTTPTPTGFGLPLDCGDWVNSEPAWLWCRTVAFELRWNELYLKLDPQPIVKNTEFQRLYLYTRSIDKPSQKNKTNNNTSGNPPGQGPSQFGGPSGSGGGSDDAGGGLGGNGKSGMINFSDTRGASSGTEQGPGAQFGGSSLSSSNLHGYNRATINSLSRTMSSKLQLPACDPASPSSGDDESDDGKLISEDEFRAFFEASPSEEMALFESLEYIAQKDLGEPLYSQSHYSANHYQAGNTVKVQNWLGGI
ncbi:hypothetical protein ABW20_dc0105394 [Dactylellina cionopaga]|nr:hypothetical protein ABW20_dc0105394 [Dactylellina cionopaga]